MRISLIGPMASGKSTVGKHLAQHLKLPFYDTDSLIETRMQISINDIFAQYGEATFRQLETETLKALFAKTEDCVIATGGGIIKIAKNRHLLKQHSKVFFLDISIAEQLKRVEGDSTRPILRVPNPEQKLRELREERLAWYQESADYTLQVDKTSLDALASHIQKITT
jgi:shikimate kinase